MDISVIVPVYNEDESIGELREWIGKVMQDNNFSYEIIMIDGRFFALNGWNGLDYAHCWECKSKFEAMDDKEHCLKPIHGYETAAGIAMMNEMNDLDEDSDEWQKNSEYLTSVVSYEVW